MLFTAVSSCNGVRSNIITRIYFWTLSFRRRNNHTTTSRSTRSFTPTAGSVRDDLGLGTLDAGQHGIPIADTVCRRTSSQSAAGFHALQFVARLDALFVQQQRVGLHLYILIDTMQLLFKTVQSVSAKKNIEGVTWHEFTINIRARLLFN